VIAPGLQQQVPGASRVVMSGCAGTRGPMDVVEVPSHLLEHFARAPAVLAAAGRHWRTREPPPSQLLDALARRERLFGALRLQQQARAGAAVPRHPVLAGARVGLAVARHQKTVLPWLGQPAVCAGMAGGTRVLGPRRGCDAGAPRETAGRLAPCAGGEGRARAAGRLRMRSWTSACTARSRPAGRPPSWRRPWRSTLRCRTCRARTRRPGAARRPSPPRQAPAQRTGG